MVDFAHLIAVHDEIVMVSAYGLAVRFGLISERLWKVSAVLWMLG